MIIFNSSREKKTVQFLWIKLTSIICSKLGKFYLREHEKDKTQFNKLNIITNLTITFYLTAKL